MRISKLFKVLVPCVALAAFLVSLQYSRSNKMLLLKDNVEAISESWYGGDPGNYTFTFLICYSNLRERKDGRTYNCNKDTYLFPYDTYEIYGAITIDNLNRTVYPCQEYVNAIPQIKSSFGFCYIMEEKK